MRRTGNSDPFNGNLDAEALQASRGTIAVAEELVEIFFQNDLRWGGDEYDHTIARPRRSRLVRIYSPRAYPARSTPLTTEDPLSA